MRTKVKTWRRARVEAWMRIIIRHWRTVRITTVMRIIVTIWRIRLPTVKRVEAGGD